MGKKYLIILLFLIINFSFVKVNAASNPYPKTSSYGTNCTWYAWKTTKEKANVILPNFGNAKDWYKNAKNAGYQVSSTPKAKSIVVWGDWTTYGHVGYVEKVDGNTIYVWDSTGPCIDEEDPKYIECMANGVSEESDKICKSNAKKIACKYNISDSQYKITGYIYLDNVPKTTTTKKKVTTKKKSSNTNLINIELSSGSIDFDKKVQTYNITVKNDIESITINAIAEDNNANIKGIGKYDLKTGLNEIKISVTAEDNSFKEYTINITREEIKTNIIIATPKQQEKNNKLFLIVMIITFLIIAMFLKMKRSK